MLFLNRCFVERQHHLGCLQCVDETFISFALKAYIAPTVDGFTLWGSLENEHLIGVIYLEGWHHLIEIILLKMMLACQTIGRSSLLLVAEGDQRFTAAKLFILSWIPSIDYIAALIMCPVNSIGLWCLVKCLLLRLILFGCSFLTHVRLYSGGACRIFPQFDP